MSYLNEMKEMLHPSSAEGYLSGKLEDYSDAGTLKNIVIAGLILLFANAISIFLMDAQTEAALVSSDSFADIITQFIDYGLFFYVSAYVLYLVARLLKGKGTFKEQIYLQSVVAVAMSIVQAILIMLSSISVSGDFSLMILLSIPLLISGLYSVYLDYKIVRVVHKFDQKNAFFSIIGFWLTIFAVYFIIYAAIYLLTGQLA